MLATHVGYTLLAKLPDCIIVGGGVVGLTLARHLARRGDRVLLLERGVCGAEASWAGAGILAPGNSHRDDPLFHFRERSLAAYPALCAALKDETGIDTEFDQCGELQVIVDDDGMRIARGLAKQPDKSAASADAPTHELLTPTEAQGIEPRVSPDILGALWCLRAGQVRNPRLLAATKASAVAAGAEICEGTEVVDFTVDGGRVTGVETNEGTRSAGWVVLCAGAWSSEIGQRLRSLMPVHPVRGQMILLKEDRRALRAIVSHGKTYLVARRDGHVLLGATEEPDSGFNKSTTAAGIAGLIQRGLKLVPSLAETPVVATWAGLRPGTPDDKPYLGAVPEWDGLIAATGHFRTGLTLAPATAEYVASVLDGVPFDLDLSNCQPGRCIASE